MMVVQADGNGRGDYMHSGMRGGPHVGAFRRCSFTETESNSKCHPRASPVIPLLVSSQQVIRYPRFRPFCNLLPEFFRTAHYKPHTLTEHTDEGARRTEHSFTLIYANTETRGGGRRRG